MLKSDLHRDQIAYGTLQMLLGGYYTSYPKISLFCALPQNYHTFLKKDICI